jgi:VanZ family protein
MRIIKILSFYYRSIILFLLILFASTIPAEDVKKVSWITIPNFDKIVHFGMYFCLSFVLVYEISKVNLKSSIHKIYLVSALISLTYGGILEIIQGTLTSTRSADIFDFLFNVIGAVFAVLAWIIIKKIK